MSRRMSPRASGRVSGGRVRAPVVLVVDDFIDNREMYGEYLAHLGFRVLEASDGRTAVDVARQERPSAIVMDLSLPVLDGWEATRILKGDPLTAGIVILVLSGHAEPASRQRALDAGCDEFMPKPCLPADLAGTVKRLLDSAPAKKIASKTRRR